MVQGEIYFLTDLDAFWRLPGCRNQGGELVRNAAGLVAGGAGLVRPGGRALECGTKKLFSRLRLVCWMTLDIQSAQRTAPSRKAERKIMGQI